MHHPEPEFALADQYCQKNRDRRKESQEGAPGAIRGQTQGGPTRRYVGQFKSQRGLVPPRKTGPDGWGQRYQLYERGGGQKTNHGKGESMARDDFGPAEHDGPRSDEQRQSRKFNQGKAELVLTAGTAKQEGKRQKNDCRDNDSVPPASLKS